MITRAVSRTCPPGGVVNLCSSASQLRLSQVGIILLKTRQAILRSDAAAATGLPVACLSIETLSDDKIRYGHCCTESIRAEAPDTIVIFTADNGTWQDAWPDAGTHPYRRKKGSSFEAGWRVPGIMWAPGKIPAGTVLHEMMSHMDVWPTTAAMVGLKSPTKGETLDNSGKPIYFDGIDNSAYVTGKAKHSARDSGFISTARTFQGMRADIDGTEPRREDRMEVPVDLERTWLGAEAEPRRYRFDLQPHHGPLREIRHDVQRRGLDPQPDHRLLGATLAWTMVGYFHWWIFRSRSSTNLSSSIRTSNASQAAPRMI